MPFQSTVAVIQGFGVPGDLYSEGPTRAAPYVLNSGDAANNVMGRAFTVTSEGVAAAGGTGAFAGLLIGPKEQALNGTALGGTLAPSLTLPNHEVGSLLVMGQVIVQVPGACAIGDRLTYNTTTGALGTVAPTATFTAAQSTTTLTVSAITAGNLGVGSVVTQASGSQSRIIALGTGTGGTGTYTLDTSQTVSSGAATATSTAPTGTAFVPNAEIVLFTPTAAGLAVAELTN